MQLLQSEEYFGREEPADGAGCARRGARRHALVPEGIKDGEIAFFGGSFTAIDRDYMIELLSSAQEFIGENGFKGIRISTRPDAVDGEICDILEKYHVTAVELGAQSTNDKVLAMNRRGHTREDIFRSARLLKNAALKLGSR